MTQAGSLEEFVANQREIGREELADALEDCADNQAKWATLGAHTTEVESLDTEEAYLVIAGFSAGRLYEKENA